MDEDGLGEIGGTVLEIGSELELDPPPVNVELELDANGELELASGSGEGDALLEMFAPPWI